MAPSIFADTGVKLLKSTQQEGKSSNSLAFVIQERMLIVPTFMRDLEMALNLSNFLGNDSGRH